MFVLLVHYQIGWPSIISTWRALDAYQLTIALCLIFSSYILRSLRLYYYCHDTLKGKAGLTLKVHLQHNFFNNILPMRSGELSFPILMKRHFQIAYLKSTGILLWFRLLDMQILGLFTIFFLFTYYAVNTWLLLIVLTIILVLPLVVLRAPFINLGETLNLAPNSKLGQGIHFLNKLYSKLRPGFPQTSTAFWQSWTLTLANWLVKMLVFSWVLMAFHPMDLSLAMLGAIGGELTSILPVHGIAGIGTYEAGVTGPLIAQGQSVDDVLVAAINLHIFLLSSTALGMLLSLVLKNRANNKD